MTGSDLLGPSECEQTIQALSSSLMTLPLSQLGQQMQAETSHVITIYHDWPGDQWADTPFQATCSQDKA